MEAGTKAGRVIAVEVLMNEHALADRDAAIRIAGELAVAALETKVREAQGPPAAVQLVSSSDEATIKGASVFQQNRRAVILTVDRFPFTDEGELLDPDDEAEVRLLAGDAVLEAMKGEARP